MIGERLPATLELMSVSFVFAAVVALPLGVYSAVRQYSLFDFSATTASFLGIAMPVFWFALILQLLFSVNPGWLPTYGRDTIGDGSVPDQLKHLVLPAFVLSLRHMPRWSRHIRSSLLDLMRADVIGTAHAKGLRERIRLSRHPAREARPAGGARCRSRRRRLAEAALLASVPASPAGARLGGRAVRPCRAGDPRAVDRALPIRRD